MSENGRYHDHNHSRTTGIVELNLDGTPQSVLALAEALRSAVDGGPAVLPLDAKNPRTSLLRQAMRPREPVEPDTALLVATSGSTGEPKGVLLSAGALLSSARATHARLGGPGHWLLATPAQFIGGIQVLVRAQVAGTEPAVLDLSQGFRPQAFADAATEILNRSGRHYTALVPTQLARLLDAGGAALDAARAFDAIVLGGAALTHALRARCAVEGVPVVPAYGMSETASGCVYDGVPLDGVELRIDGEPGPIEIAGPVLAHGYRLRPDLTGKAFADGWFRTGDLGRFTAEGRLEVLGRVDDVINTGGVKVAPTLVERVLTAQPGVAEACVLGLADPDWGQLVAAAVVPRGEEPAERTLAEAVRAELGAAHIPRVFLFLAELPARGPGKVDRAALREAFVTHGKM